jgi:hypothetical protein
MKKFRDLHIRSTPHALQGSLAAYAAKLWNGIWFRFKRWGVAHCRIPFSPTTALPVSAEKRVGGERSPFH